jgi:hypothetical protein
MRWSRTNRDELASSAHASDLCSIEQSIHIGPLAQPNARWSTSIADRCSTRVRELSSSCSSSCAPGAFLNRLIIGRGDEHEEAASNQGRRRGERSFPLDGSGAMVRSTKLFVR